MITMLLVNAALAMPFDGCTFFKDRLASHSWPAPGEVDRGCANYHVEEQACVKTKYVGATLVTYQGDLVSGRSPEYMIEVTPHFGKSVFSRAVDGQHLQAQMEAAEQFWRAELKATGQPASNLGGASSATNNKVETAQLLHARAIRTPYGVPTWSWPELGVVNAGAAVAPLCFLGISENSPTTWSDVEGHPETLTAAVFNAIPGLCDVPAISQLNNRVDPPGDRPVEACSLPSTRAQIIAGLVLPDSEVMDAVAFPTLACAGRFGPLFPRNGWVMNGTVDELTNAQKVAYKFASLSKDHFVSGPGIEAGDRWQIVWPPALNPVEAACYVPGSARPLVELVPLAHRPMVPGSDGATQRPRDALEGSSSLIVAVWRPWTKCVEPGQGALWQGYMSSVRAARVAACAVNPLSGP